METIFRPIHYLGSKLRILDFINDAINEADPSKGTVFDLFSGSGVVSKYLSSFRPVISNDIQEYSRIICSALLLPCKKVAFKIPDQIFDSAIYRKLHSLFEPLIIYEEEALEKLRTGNMVQIAELLAFGSLMNYQYNESTDTGGGTFRNALRETINRLAKDDLLNSNKSIVTRYYGGLYFSFLQAVTIDALLEIMSTIDNSSKLIFHAAILSTASEIVNTVGKQFAQPLNPYDSKGNPKLKLANKICKDRSHDTASLFGKWLDRYNNQVLPRYNNVVLKGGFTEALAASNNVKVVYADPPYTRYHYSRYYHVLETISLRDNPQISLSNIKGHKVISRGVYRIDRHQSPFGLKSESDKAFNSLFNKVCNRRANLVLSYSPYDHESNATPRAKRIDDIVNIAKTHFKKVRTRSFGTFSHSKLNKSELHIEASDNAELLVICMN